MANFKFPNFIAPEMYKLSDSELDPLALDPKNLEIRTKWEQTKAMVLHPWQVEYYPSVQWLFDETSKYRGEGRTQILACIYIDAALRNPGVWLYPMDHFEPFHQGNPFAIKDNLYKMIQSLLLKGNMIHPFQFKHSGFGFCYLGYNYYKAFP